MKKSVIDSIRDFNRFYTNFIGILDKDALQLNYSLTELRVIYEVSKNQGISAVAITKMLSLDEGYTSRIVAKFVKDGIISKIRSQEDSRLYLLALTEKGVDLATKIEERSDEQVNRLFNHLSDAEAQELAKLVTRVKNIINKQDYAGAGNNI